MASNFSVALSKKNSLPKPSLFLPPKSSSSPPKSPSSLPKPFLFPQKSSSSPPKSSSSPPKPSPFLPFSPVSFSRVVSFLRLEDGSPQTPQETFDQRSQHDSKLFIFFCDNICPSSQRKHVSCNGIKFPAERKDLIS